MARTVHGSGRAPGPRKPLPLWLGYLPLVLVCALVVVMVVVVPSEAPGTGAAAGQATEVPVGQTASGWDDTVTPCADRALQIEGDGYSPPCFDFSGDNGGATARGVTAETITVGYRVTSDPNLLATLSQLAGMPIDESPEDLARTAEGLVDYFNRHAQLYGRKIELRRTEGRGQLIAEFTGGGQDAAGNDALKTADEVGAFADVTALSQPYAEALSRNGVVNIGAPYMSAEWFESWRPYAWSNTPDCTVAGTAATEYAVKHLLGRPAAHARGDLAGQERRIAVIAPDNREYQQCVERALDVVEEAGHELTLALDYVLDLAQLQSQAVGLMARLRDADITSVACACDPLTILYLTQLANQQGYDPEWLVVGVGFVDLDVVGQLVDNGSGGGQWERAFGGSPFAAQPPPGTGAAHRAYTSVRDDVPSILVDFVYYQIYALVIGLQMAGPELTPETFETGMFAYPGGTGVAGTWDFDLGHRSAVSDVREIWWDPHARSPWNGQPGAYRDDGKRYRLGELPEGEPEVFG